jgi:YidC/Oxa1 family membrane protein insertase
MSDQKNLFIAIAISLVVLLGFQYFYEMPRAERQRAEQAAQVLKDVPKAGAATDAQAPQAPGTAAPTPAAAAPKTREEVLAGGERIKIATPKVRGSIALTGGRIDDLVLTEYRETVDPKSPEIVLLAPAGSPQAYYAEFGWTAAPSEGAKLPDGATVWQADGAELSAAKPITLSWNNGEGLTFRRTIAIDQNYMFTVTQKVENATAKKVTLFPYALVQRQGTPHTEGLYILHEGPLGVFRDKADSSGTLKEYSYKDVVSDKSIEFPSIGGWIGITDKYWLTALVPGDAANVKARFSHVVRDGDRYQVDLLGSAVEVEQGQAGENVQRLFAGAKVVNLIDSYADQYKIARFDRAIDWGWFYFLTRPVFFCIDFFFHVFGNFGLAILTLTIIIKFLFLPLAYKSYVSMSQMKALQPEMTALREKYGEDRAKLNEEMMALYRRAKVNPAAGCFPVLLQVPVFYALYKVLYTTIEMRQAPFYGWIKDLSAPDPTTWINLFGLLPFDKPMLGPIDIINIGAWPLIMGVTMWLQMRLNPQPPDPVQARIFSLMPIIFTFMLGGFAAGLVIYWSWNNTLSILQQTYIMRRTARQAQAQSGAKA